MLAGPFRFRVGTKPTIHEDIGQELGNDLTQLGQGGENLGLRLAINPPPAPAVWSLLHFPATLPS